MNIKNKLSLIIASMTVIALSGCEYPGKVTGGGWIPSASDIEGEKANFGFNGKQCDEDENGDLLPAKGRFNYHDKNAPGFEGGVKMNGTVLETALCIDTGDWSRPLCFCGDGDYQIEFEYRSTNPKYKGDKGYGLACVTDNGEGAQATFADRALVYVSSGPFAGYYNSGKVQGNIQGHECD